MMAADMIDARDDRRRDGGWQGFKKRLKRLGHTSKPGDRFNRRITQLPREDRNLLVFALRRKRSKEAFEMPIHGLYAEAIDGLQLACSS